MTNLPQITADALARHWSRILLRPTPPAAVVIMAAGAPAALLVPLDLAARTAAARQAGPVQTFTAAAAHSVLLDLIYRAQRLDAPTGITCQAGPGMAIVPLTWAADLASAIPAPVATLPERITR
jgi:hypothetical protein